MVVVREYGVSLDSEKRIVHMQFPLLKQIPRILSISGSREKDYLEAQIEQEYRVGEREESVEQRSVGRHVPFRSDYYVLRVRGDTIVGGKIDKLLQMRHTFSHLDKPREESEEHRKRRREKSEREELVQYRLEEGHDEQEYREEPRVFERRKEHSLDRDIERVRKTIYSARVCNLSTILSMHTLPEDLVRSLLDQMTFRFHGRYCLRREYWGEVGTLLESVLHRVVCEEGRSYFVMSQKELCEKKEDLRYVLEEISAQEGCRYYLKGWREHVAGEPETDMGSYRRTETLKEELGKAIVHLQARGVMGPLEAERVVGRHLAESGVEKGFFGRLRNMYILKSKGSLNRQRQLLVFLLEERDEVTTGEVEEYLRSRSERVVSSADTVRLLKEFCAQDGVLWRIKPAE
jgi:hypothetical protein